MINFRKWLPYLLYSCKRVSAIISINPDYRTTREQFILNYHKVICKACHNYQFQNKIIDEALTNSLKENGLITLSNDKKVEIISNLKAL